MIVRRAIPGDVPDIRALEVELFGGEAWSHTAIEPELAGEDRVALVAVDRGSLVGYVALRITGHDADLNRIAVNPLYQRRGIASRLLAAALESARTSEVTRLLLEVAEHNEAARRSTVVRALSRLRAARPTTATARQRS